MVGVKKYQTCTLLSFFSGMYTYKEVSLYHEKKKQTQAEMTELDANKTILCNFKVPMEQFSCLLTSDYITPLSFIYIDVHGSSGSVRICDLNRNIINRGDKYISDIIGFQHNPKIRVFRGNHSRHLTISLVVCGAAESKDNSEYCLASEIHKRLYEDHGIFTEILARKGFVSTKPYDDKKYICSRESGMFLHQPIGAKFRYYWQRDDDGHMIQCKELLFKKNIVLDKYLETTTSQNRPSELQPKQSGIKDLLDFVKQCEEEYKAFGEKAASRRP